MYLSFRMSGFHDELSKIAGAGRAVGHFAAGMLSPAFDAAHHAVSASHPGHLHIGSRAGHLGALAGTAGIVGGAYHLGKKKGMQKQSEGFGGPNITDGDEMAKMGGLTISETPKEELWKSRGRAIGGTFGAFGGTALSAAFSDNGVGDVALIGGGAGLGATAGHFVGKHLGRRHDKKHAPKTWHYDEVSEETPKTAGFLKNTLVGMGMMGATAGGAHAVKAMAKPAAQIAKAPRMIGAASSQMADLAREGVKFASRSSR